MTHQTNLFEILSYSEAIVQNDPEQQQPVADTKVEGMQQGFENADHAWKKRALSVIEAVCRRKDYFCSDDIEDELSKYPEQTHDKRALGGLFRKAAKLGFCEQTQTFVISKQPKSHACPRRLWRSAFKQP